MASLHTYSRLLILCCRAILGLYALCKGACFLLWYYGDGFNEVRLARCVAHMIEMRIVYKILVGKTEGMRPHGRSRRRWEHNIRICLGEVEWEDMDWVLLAQDGDQWCSDVLFSQGVGNFLTGWDTEEGLCSMCEGMSKCFWTEAITK